MKINEHFPTPLLSIKEASREFGVKENTLRSWVRDRRIPYYKGRKLVRFARKDLENLFIRVPTAREVINGN